MNVFPISTFRITINRLTFHNSHDAATFALTGGVFSCHGFMCAGVYFTIVLLISIHLLEIGFSYLDRIISLPDLIKYDVMSKIKW